MDDAGGRQVARFFYYAADVFHVFRNFTLSDLCVSFVRFLRRGFAIFNVRGDLCQDARCLCVVFFGSSFLVWDRATVRDNLATGYGRGTFKSLFLGRFLCRMQDRQRRMGLVYRSFKDLCHDGVQISRGHFGPLFFRNFRYLQAKVIRLANLASF